MSFMKKLGGSVVSGAKKVGEAHAAVGSAVAEGVGSAYHSVVDSKGDPSSRCFVMVKEAAAFREQLKKAEKDLRTLAAAAEGMLDGGRAVLEAPLPHLYEETAVGGAAKPAQPIGGPAFAGAAVVKAKADLQARLQAEVWQPLLSWEAAMKDAEAKQKAVNKLYGEREAARKKLEALKAKADELRAKQGPGDPKAAEKYEEAVKAVAQQGAALTVATERHQREEEEVYAKLVPLVREAARLAGWIKAGMVAVSAALAAGGEAVPSPDPSIQGLSLS